jgi:hypothetical protein
MTDPSPVKVTVEDLKAAEAMLLDLYGPLTDTAVIFAGVHFARHRIASTTEAADLIAELVEALRKSNRIIEALADNDLAAPIAANGMTVGAALQYEAPKLAFSNCALLAKLSGIGTQVSDKAGFRVMTGETQIGGDMDCSEDATTLCMNLNAQAAIAAVFQEIRAAAGREDVVDAGLLEYEGEYALDNKVLRDGMRHSMKAMLDQIERTQKP